MSVPVGRTLRAVIVDADAPARRQLCEQLRLLVPELEVVGEPPTAEAAGELLARGGYDVVFLETCVAGKCGFALVPLVAAHAATVFVAARSEDAARAFEVEALDFVTKPVSAPRLARTMRQVVEFAARRRIPGEMDARVDGLFLRRARGGGRFVALNEIVAVTSAENYSDVHLADGEQWMVRRTMDSWQEILPREQFARVHRTVIVNLGSIERIERDARELTELEVRGLRRRLPVSRRAWTHLRGRLRGAV